MDENLIQWHPGCLSAINLEFVQNKHGNIFGWPHYLTTYPKNKLKEDSTVCEALMELFKPEFDAKLKEEVEKKMLLLQIKTNKLRSCRKNY